MDKAHRAVDALIRAAGVKIHGIFRDALKKERAELLKCEADWASLSGHLRGDALERARKKYFIRSEEAKARIERIAAIIADANSRVAEEIQKTLPEVFLLGYNEQSDAIKKLCDLTGEVFSIMDEDMLAGILEKDPAFLPTITAKTKSTVEWNKKMLRREFIKAVTKGESVQKMAERFKGVTGANESVCLRQSRNMFTTAENRGRFKRHEENESRFKKYGYTVKFQWIATSDSRTRPHHRELNGTFANEKGYFKYGLRYAGDRQADPAEWQNCRCTNIEVLANSEN